MLNVDDARRNGLSDVGPSPADRVAEEILYQRVQAWLKDRFREAELLEPGAHVDSAVREAIGKVMQAYRREAAIAGTPGLDDPAGVEQRLADRVLGFGYLAPLLADPDNEEIQAIGGRVRIYRHGRWELVEHLAPDDAETLRLVRRLLAPGDRIDESSPEVESTLPDGSRLTAVIPPETEQVTLTIRRYVVRHHRLADLGTLPSEAVALVEAYARGGASIITAGPGGAGKTTLLRCIVAAGDPSRTICSIEDVRELALHQYHPAAIPLYARRANIEGAGARTYRELMRTALRLRPDVLVVGECRGAEALDWLLAAATGHQCLGTLHSDSPRGALRQLGTFAQLATEGINAHAIGEMIAEHFDLVIVCGFGPDGARRITHIFEVTGLGKDGVIDGSDLWVLDPETGHLVPTGVRPRRLERLRAHGNHNGLAGRLVGFGAALLLVGGALFVSGVRL
jgi:pilus assembly protein CpaF